MGKRTPIYKEFKCSECGYTWTAARGYKNLRGDVVCLSCKKKEDSGYLKDKIFLRKSQVCSVCGKEFESVRTYRNSNGDVVCYECKKSESPEYYGQSVRICTCSKCGREFQAKNVHKDSEGNIVCYECYTHVCSICGKEYNSSRPFYNSKGQVVCLECKKAESPECTAQKVQTLTCSKCGRVYTSKKALRFNGEVLCLDCMKILNPEYNSKVKKTSVCEYCGKEYSSKFSYTHDGKTVCLECKKKLEPGFFDHPSDTQLSFERRNSEERVTTITEEQSVRFELVELKKDSEGETIFRFRCKSCGTEFERNIRNLQVGKFVSCPNEVCSAGHSKSEIDLRNYVRGILRDETISNTKRLIRNSDGNSVELDIYVPDKDIAIEYDGMYWHSDVDNSYKFEECRKIGIRLIQITDFEWCGKLHEIVKSYLKETFGIFDVKIGARKCEIKEVPNSEYKEFVESNHLQGYVPASVRLGLYYNGSLVELISLGRSRFDQSSDWELLRECSKRGYKVIGGKEKLIGHFIKTFDPITLISYCDKSKFTGNSYLRCGFKLEGTSGPNYYYVKYEDGEIRVLNRVSAQKHKLEGLLGKDNFDPLLTESQNMINNGWTRLYNYGTMKFVYRKDVV